ncbi:MAG: choice-of-anchor D domain-containing protein [Solirubrobacterales bacterium]|nr:choice-of-anchor D domain-containing protein [Solirubrobacterales bacterium]
MSMGGWLSVGIGRAAGSRPVHGIRRAAVGFVVYALVVFGALLTAGSANAASVLSPSPSSLDFGGVDMHFQQTMQEWFYNNSGSPVTVDPAGVKILGDTSSFSLQVGQDFCTGNTIPAGGSCHVNVLLGPLSSPGAKSATLELTDNTGTVDVPLTGTGFSGTLSLNPSSLDFGSQVIQSNNNGGSAQQSVTVATGRDFGVRVTNVQIIGADASSFSVQGNGCQGFTLGSNNTCQIYVQFQPLTTGPKQARLEIDNDGTVSPLFVSLSGVGLNGPALSVSPKQAIFGNVLLGSSTSQTFTLTNAGDAPLQLQELFVASGSPQVFPMSDGCAARQLAPGAACQVTVGFIPIAVGVKDASLFVISNQGPVSIIGLSGAGVAPNSGSSGATGATGPAGPTGPRGPAGPPGTVVLVTCKSLTKTVAKLLSGTKHKVREKVQKCTGRRVGSTVKVTVSVPSGRAMISRGRVVYATGKSLTIGGGRWLLLLTEQRGLKPGRYTLTVRSRHKGRWSTRRGTITLN